MKGSGTCNVCAAPCSSCMHFNQEISFMESKAEGAGYSENSCGGKEGDDCLSNVAETPVFKSKQCDNRIPAASETSVDMPLEVRSFETDEDNQLCLTSPCKPMNASVVLKTSPSPQGHHGSECHGDNSSCVTSRTNRNIAVDDKAADDIPGTSASALCSRSLETPSLAKPVDGEIVDPHRDIKECSVAPEEPSSSEQVTTDDVDRHKCSRISKESVNAKSDASEDDGITADASSQRSSVQFSESESGAHRGDLSDGSGDHGPSHEHHEKKISSMEKPHSQESSPNPRQKSADDHSAPENLEDDVKVCDICGDAGREDLLAICSRCSDGAEHTYCMRIMLNKLPEGDWLCEECSMKDTEASKAEKTETLPMPLKEQPQKASPNAEVPLLGIGLKNSETSVKKHLGKPELSSLPSSKLLDPSRKSVLSRESSSKSLDSGKVKPISNSVLPSVSPSSSIPVVSRPLVPAPSLSKNQGLQQVLPSRGLLSRSGSITGLKPKVKQLTDNIPQKPANLAKESASVESKESTPRTLTKSLSLKNVSPALLSSSESISKSQSLILPRPEEPRNQKQNKERTMERKSSFVLNRSSSSSPTTSAMDSTASHLNEGLENTSDKVGQKELKKLASSKTLCHPMGNDVAIPVLIKEDAHMDPSSDVKTEKVKDSSTFGGSSRQLAPPPKRIVRCQKCNETGHSTQFCSIDKIRVAALKPSAERNSKEAVTKSSKWRDAIDFAISKGREQKILPDRSDGVSGNGLSPATVPQIPTSSAVSLSKSDDLGSKQNKLSPHMVPPCTAVKSGVNAASPLVEDQKLDASRILALPEHEHIWQGSFELKRSGRLSEICEGFQAHLSTRASPKVPEVVTKFPDKVQLEEVNRLSSWPLQFQEKGPTEENIALFFFAKDVKSYENGYRKLVETMLKNDSALKGNFDGIELLIFPSTKLPEKSQRWNRLFFLWGVFRERRSTRPEVPSAVEKKPTAFDLELPARPASPLNEVLPLKREPPGLTAEHHLPVNATANNKRPCNLAEVSTPQRPMPSSGSKDSNNPSRPTAQSFQEEAVTRAEPRLPADVPVLATSSSTSQARSNPWPPDLNLECQEADDEPAENRDEMLNGGSTWATPLPEKKRTRSQSPLPWRQIAESSSIPLDGDGEGDGDESKRMRLLPRDTAAAVVHGSGSSKVHPFVGWQPTVPERHFFPLGSGIVAAEPSVELPNLELALGAEKKRPTQREILPFSFQAVASRSLKEQGRNDVADDIGDDISSLSLSLGICFSDKQKPAPPPQSAKQPPVGSSLFLFDRFHDS